MSSVIVYPQGTASVTLIANESIAVYSKGATLVSRRVGYPNFPTQDSVLGTVLDGETVFGPYTGGATIIVAAGPSQALYQTGISPRVTEVSSVLAINGAPNALNTTGALTAAMILGRIVTSSTAAAVAGTVPTGTVLDAASDFAIGDEVEWTLINTGPNTFTVTAATDHTIVGVAAVLTLVQASFITRKTAANTYITYRKAG